MDNLEMENLTRLQQGNVSRPRIPRPPAQVCGLCNISCVYAAVELVFIVGIAANFLVVFRVIRDQRLRKPTFVALAQLALTEGLYLLFHTVLNVELILYKTLCHTRSILWTYFRGVNAMFWFSATFHVTLLAAMRYIILVHPFKSLKRLSNKRIIIASVIIWIVSILIFGSIMLISRLSTQREDTEIYIKATTWFLTYFTPIVMTGVLHIVKISGVRKLTRRTDTNTQAEQQKSSMRMVKIIAIIIIAGALLPLPRFILMVLQELSSFRFKDKTLRSHIYGIAGILFLLNFSINPFIYSLSSETFRRSLRRMTLSSASEKHHQYEHDTKTTSLSSPALKIKHETRNAD